MTRRGETVGKGYDERPAAWLWCPCGYTVFGEADTVESLGLTHNELCTGRPEGAP